MDFPLQIAIFHSDVKLPEGIPQLTKTQQLQIPDAFPQMFWMSQGQQQQQQQQQQQEEEQKQEQENITQHESLTIRNHPTAHFRAFQVSSRYQNNPKAPPSTAPQRI